jgi:hypothetical protein
MLMMTIIVMTMVVASSVAGVVAAAAVEELPQHPGEVEARMPLTFLALHENEAAKSAERTRREGLPRVTSAC